MFKCCNLAGIFFYKVFNCLYCYTDGTLSRVYTWDSNIPMSYISKISEKELALFYPCSEAHDGEEFYVYRILRVHSGDHTGEEIAQFQYNITGGEGEIVPTVDYSNGLFHIFVKSVQGSGSSYSICALDADGEKTAEYSIDLEDFLYLEPVSSYDSVYRIRCLEGSFFVLQTLNSRIIIFEEAGGRLVQVEAPECLRAFPEGYKIAESCGGRPGEIYFVNMFQDNLIKFDTSSRQFTESTIEKGDDESYIKSVYINPDGNILVNMDGYFYTKKLFLKAHHPSTFHSTSGTEPLTSGREAGILKKHTRHARKQVRLPGVVRGVKYMLFIGSAGDCF